ncbi:MAG: hypothetical protein EB120_07850 [Proteobacteria bacterium]|nr:hypothetical protein [Pseudomonadota bacterium]NDC24169.1 hypothetical protein [Pseudomonadota bacterium]NDG27071.1 hypothetical protein [Pseudomonadota bacterium]
MKKFGSLLILLAVILTACGRDGDQAQPAPQPGPGGNGYVQEEPVDGGYVGGYCGLLCRWRLRRMQRRQGYWCDG